MKMRNIYMNNCAIGIDYDGDPAELDIDGFQFLNGDRAIIVTQAAQSKFNTLAAQLVRTIEETTGGLDADERTALLNSLDEFLRTDNQRDFDRRYPSLLSRMSQYSSIGSFMQDALHHFLRSVTS